MKKLLLLLSFAAAILFMGCEKAENAIKEDEKPAVYTYEVYGSVNYVFYEPSEGSKEVNAGANYRSVTYEPGQSVRVIVQYKNSTNRLIKLNIKRNGIEVLRDSSFVGKVDVIFKAN